MINSEVKIKSTAHKIIDCGTIKIGHGGLMTMEIAGFIKETGEELFSREGHSYLNGFGQLLYSQMKQLYSLSNPITIYELLPNGGLSAWGTAVTNATQATTCRITKFDIGSLASSWIWIEGETGMTELNRVKYWGKLIGGNTLDLYTDEAETTPLNSTGFGAWAGGGKLYYIGQPDSGTGISSLCFNLPTVVVGLSTKAVEIEDFYLDELTTGLDDQSVNFVDEPVVSTTDSYIQITRDFANSTGGPVTVEEVGSYVRVDSSPDRVFFSRDLQTIVIPDTQTLTMRLRYKTVMDLAAGGITRMFNDLLYRMMRGLSFSTFNLAGGTVNSSPVEEMFATVGVGGGELWGAGGSPIGGIDSYLTGPVLGVGNVTSLPLSPDNFDLDDRVLHGRGTGLLVHHGTIIHELVTDIGAPDSVSFKISRLFKNESGGTISPTEVGLVVNGDGSHTHNHLIVRKIHDGAGGRPVAVDILNNEVAEAVFTLEVAV